MTHETKLWGGRFSEGTAASVEQFTASIHYDCRLYKHDIAGSRAHAKMLAEQGLISQQECSQILGGLDQIEQEIQRPFKDVEFYFIHWTQGSDPKNFHNQIQHSDK